MIASDPVAPCLSLAGWGPSTYGCPAFAGHDESGPRVAAVTPEIALLLAQDGISTGAIYVLVALGIVLIFLVTRVIFVPFGDVVGYSALTVAALQLRQMPGTVWLVLTLATLATVMEAYGLVRRGQIRGLPK